MQEKGGNHLVPCLDSMVDTLKVPNQAPRVFCESLQTCVALYRPNETQHLLC